MGHCLDLRLRLTRVGTGSLVVKRVSTPSSPVIYTGMTMVNGFTGSSYSLTRAGSSVFPLGTGSLTVPGVP